MEPTAKRIKMAMDLRGVRQSDLVEKTKISKGALSSYITGRYVPKQNNIYLIAKALNVSELWLMGLDGPAEHIESFNIGNRIRILRKKNEITQTELAKKIGSTKQNIYKYENGLVTNIPYDKLILLAKALGTTPVELIGWKDEPEQLPEKEDREIGHDLDRIMDKIENNSSGPLYYNGELIDDDSLEILRKLLELGLSQLKKKTSSNSVVIKNN